MSTIEFKEWPKIPRGKGEGIVITEKLDGTNACVIIEDGYVVGCQSRKRMITPEDDNYGFAKWVQENACDLTSLGDGYHYGEWAGLGIQKNPHNIHEKQFFLFNSGRWSNNEDRPSCCQCVPVLFTGQNTPENIDNTLDDLWDSAEGEYIPEGIVVYFTRTRRYEKYTFKNQQGKWKAA